MNDSEILTAAIKKAWPDATDIIATDIVGFTSGGGRQIAATAALIFSHDFAKAFWGNQHLRDCPGCGDMPNYEWPLWEYHLQKMVIEEDPIQYLKQFLND